jgi:2-keto-4-pentenoate hydratase
MLQFVVHDGPGEVRTVICSEFPFVMGRSSSAALQLSAAGVWDQHAEVSCDASSGRFLIQPIGEALLLVNGARSEGKALVPGDEIQLGAVTLTVSLSPVVQTRLSVAELPLWVLLGCAFLVEILLIVILR